MPSQRFISVFLDGNEMIFLFWLACAYIENIFSHVGINHHFQICGFTLGGQLSQRGLITVY